MNINQMKESKYCRKEDVGEGVLVTVKGVTSENLAQDGQPEEIKYVLNFTERDMKPLVLNWTNIQLCAKVCGSEDTDDWSGKKIVLYTDENVSFGGKLTGGVRIRAPRGQAAKAEPKPEKFEATDDQIPF